MAVPNITPSDLKISNYLLKHCNLWVWDFDDTLIDTSVYYVKSMEPESIYIRTNEELDKEIPSWKYFRKLVIYLVSSGKRVGIASFGTFEIIKAYMDRIFGFNQKYFTTANIMASYKEERLKREFTLPINKNPYIYQLMKFYNIQDYQKVVLFDDLPSNVNDAATIGILAIQIEGRDQNKINKTLKLFSEEIMDKIDYDADIRCNANIYLRSNYGSIGHRKGPIRDKQFGVSRRQIYSDRIYVDENAQQSRLSEQLERERQEKLNQIQRNIRRKRELNMRNEDSLRYNERTTTTGSTTTNPTTTTNLEGFNNKTDIQLKECNFCSKVAGDKYVWILLLLLVLFMIYVIRK